MKGTEKVQGPTRGNGKKMADVTDPVSRPQDWDKVLLAAHLWLTLTTQKEAAKGAGIGERSLQRWITCRWWKQACSEVEGQWTHDLVRESRRTLLHSVRHGDADKAFKVLERLDPTFSNVLPASNGFAPGITINFPARDRAHPDKEVNEIIWPPRDTNR
jgi:hypothetical protein